MSAKELLSLYENASKSDREYLETIVFNVSLGIEWAEVTAKEPEICQPAKLALTMGQVMSMLQLQVQTEPLNAAMPYGLVVFRSMKRTFPCKKPD